MLGLGKKYDYEDQLYCYIIVEGGGGGGGGGGCQRVGISLAEL